NLDEVRSVSNTAFGYSALRSNTGSENTATGTKALFSNTTGSTNTASGVNALTSNTTGSGNTASGVSVLSHNTAGNDNVATGEGALLENLIGSKNTAIGTETLARSTGNKNIAIGFRAGIQLITGHNNVYLDNRGSAVESQTMRLGDSQERTVHCGHRHGGRERSDGGDRRQRPAWDQELLRPLQAGHRADGSEQR